MFAESDELPETRPSSRGGAELRDTEPCSYPHVETSEERATALIREAVDLVGPDGAARLIAGIVPDSHVAGLVVALRRRMTRRVM